MNINRYALCKERSLQKIISKQPKPNTTAIGVCSETQVTHHIITKRSDECLPISAYVPKHKDGPSWCEAAIYYADEDVVTSEPYNSFYNHWVCQTANATYHLYMGVADTE